ncbi:FeoB-associated Cys-rich membrane protein [Peptostreptococcus anaerobius]
MNLSTGIVLAIVIVAAVLAFKKVKSEGACNCGTGCGGCKGSPSEKKK